MKMWKPIRRSLAILMTLAMLMSLVPAMGVAAADDGVNLLGPVDGSVQGAGNMVTSESTAPYGPLALVNNGKFAFTLLSADEYSEMVLYFADAVNKRTGADVAIGESGSSSTYEMIIGKYDARSTSNDIYAELTNYRNDNASDYIVRLVGTKLYVVATTNYALQKGLDYVLDTYIKDDQGKIPADLNVKVRPHHYLRDMFADGSKQEVIIAGHKISEFVIRTERYPSLLVQRSAVAIQEFFMENYGVVIPIVPMNTDGTNVSVDGRPEIRVGPKNGAVNMIRPEYTSFTQDNWQEHMTIETDGLIPGDYGYYEMSWDGDNIQINGGSVYAINAATVRFMQMFEDLIKSKTTSLTPATTFSGNYESGYDYIYGRGYETVDFSLLDGYGLVYTDEFDYVGSDQKIKDIIRSKWTLSEDMNYPQGEIGGEAKSKENAGVFPNVYGENWWFAADANGNNYLFEIAKKHDKETQVIGGKKYDFYEGVRLASQDKWGFRYGIWETRAIMGTHNGSASAVWSHTKAPYDDELYWHEIDVYENYGQDAFVPCLHAFDNTVTADTVVYPAANAAEPVNVWIYSGQFDDKIYGKGGGVAHQSESWELPAEGEHFWDTFHHMTVEWTYDYLRVSLDGEVVSRIILGEEGPQGAPQGDAVNKVEGVYENLFDCYRAGQTIKLSNGVGSGYYCRTQPVGQPVAAEPYTPDYFEKIGELANIDQFFEVMLVDYTRVYQTDNKFISYEPAKNDIRFSDNFDFIENSYHRLGQFNGAQSFEIYDEGQDLTIAGNGAIVATEEEYLAGYTSAKLSATADAQMVLYNNLAKPFTVAKGSDYIVSFYVKVPETENAYNLKYQLFTDEGTVVDMTTVRVTEKGGWQKIEAFIEDCAYSGDLKMTIGASTSKLHTFYIEDIYVELQPETHPADEAAMNFENLSVGKVLMSNAAGSSGNSSNNEGSSVTISDKRAYTGTKSAMFVTDTHSVNGRAQMNVLDADGNNVKLEKGKDYWLSFKVYIEKQHYNKYDAALGSGDRAIVESAFNFYAACVPDNKLGSFFSSSYKYDTSYAAYSEEGNLTTNKSGAGTANPDHQARNEWFEVSVKIEDCAVEGNLRIGLAQYSQAKLVCFVDDIRVYEGTQNVTVKFDMNGGDGAYSNLNLERGESITAAITNAGLAEPTRDHYIFRGWHTDEDFTEGTFINFCKTDDAEENVVDAYGGEEVTLYARWQGAEHTYDDDEDAVCNDCGSVREIVKPCEHAYDGCTDADCNLCGEVRETSDHVYDDCNDADCNVCGVVRGSVGHVYSNACDSSCNECGEKRVAAHSYSSNLDTRCDVCDALRWVSDVSPAVLNGKTALFVGDSITFGDKDTPRGDGWAKRIADLYGMTTTNRGEPGAELSDKGDKFLHNKFVEGNFDYVILQGGFNDMMLDGMEVGVFTASKDPADFDTATFAGGLDRYFQMATTMYPNARIGFIITYDMPEAYTWAMYSQADEFWAMAKEICAKWDVAYLDLYAPKYSEDVLKTDTRTYLADGVHLNADGYDVIAPYIASWMATLMKHSGVNKHVDDDSFDFSGDEITSFTHSYHSACDVMCYECGAVREVAHLYDGGCDALCNVCGERRRVKVEHTYDNDADVDCNVCGEIREIEVHEHEYDNACDAECNTCGASREVDGHIYDNACDVDCNVCGAVREVEDHIYDNACDADCNACGAVREGVAHAFPASGSSSDTCATCGAKRPKINGATLKLESRINIIWYVYADTFEANGFENPFIVFNFNNEEIVANEYREGTMNNRPAYLFDFSEVAAKMMTDEVTATVYAYKDGEKVTGTTTVYSVLQYCTSTINKIKTKTNLATLIVDLLNYGTLAQMRFNWNLDKLANANLTEEQKGWATTADPTLEYIMNNKYETCDRTDVAVWKSVSLLLEDAVTMVFGIDIYDAADVYGLTYEVQIGDAEPITWTPSAPVEGEEVVDNGLFKIQKEPDATKPDRYNIYFSGLEAKQMREQVLIKAYKDGEIVTNTLMYTIEAYAQKNQAVSKEYLGELVKAMMKYGDSAEAYFLSPNT